VGTVAGTILANDGDTDMHSDKIVPMALKISEACDASRCGRTTLYEAIKRGELRAVKRGKSTLILEADLRRWLESLPAINANREEAA
jgi:excisionase family DNA binding protein